MDVEGVVVVVEDVVVVDDDVVIVVVVISSWSSDTSDSNGRSADSEARGRSASSGLTFFKHVHSGSMSSSHGCAVLSAASLHLFL